MSNIKAYWNSAQTSKMEDTVKIVIFLINSILDVRLDSEYFTLIKSPGVRFFDPNYDALSQNNFLMRTKLG